MVQICASYRPLSQIRCSVWSAKCATSRFLTRLMVAGNLKENSKLLASRRPRCSSLSASRPPPPLRRCGRLPRSSDAPNRHRISQLPLFLSIGCSCLITLNYLRFSIYVVIVSQNHHSTSTGFRNINSVHIFHIFRRVRHFLPWV